MSWWSAVINVASPFRGQLIGFAGVFCGLAEEHAGSLNWLWPIVETGIKAVQSYNTRYPSSPQVLHSGHVITACVPAFTSYDVNTAFSFRYYYGKSSHQKSTDHRPVTNGLFPSFTLNKSQTSLFTLMTMNEIKTTTRMYSTRTEMAYLDNTMS